MMKFIILANTQLHTPYHKCRIGTDDCVRRRLLTPLSVAARHYNHERNHQGIGNVLIEPKPPARPVADEPPLRLPGTDSKAPLHCQPRLGGLLKFYCRPAA